MVTSIKETWKAVAILAGDSACAAARTLQGTRFLARSAPRLPLPECTQQDKSECNYRDLRDRRGPPRRAGDEGSGPRPLQKT